MIRNAVFAVLTMTVICLFGVGVHFLGQYERQNPPESRIPIESVIKAPLKAGDVLEIHGVAVVEYLNRNGTVVDVDSLLKSFVGPVPLLADHVWETSAVIGKVYKLEIVGDYLFFEAEMYVTEDTLDLANHLIRSDIQSVSIGMIVTGVQNLEEVDKLGAAPILEGELVEISLVAVPAVKEARIYYVGKK